MDNYSTQHPLNPPGILVNFQSSVKRNPEELGALGSTARKPAQLIPKGNSQPPGWAAVSQRSEPRTPLAAKGDPVDQEYPCTASLPLSTARS